MTERFAWDRLGRPVQVAAVGTLVLCAAPPATNFGPGPAGYVLALIVLTAGTLWLADDAGPWPISRGETVALGALYGWVGLGILRSGDQWDMALGATVLALLAVACPLALTSRVGPRSMDTPVILVCGATVIGSAIAAWLVPPVLGQGIGLRPGLPIGGASNNAVGLTLALAGTLLGARRWPEHRWAWRLLALVAIVLVLQSVSRAGWILALVVLVAAAQLHRHWDPRKVALAGITAAVLVVGGLMTLRESTLVDPARSDNAATALGAWSDSVPSVLVGQGSMRVWPWLGLERDWAAEGVPGSMLHDGPWGEVLYHAHSTYLLLLVEHGIIGLVALLVVLAFVVRRCVVEIRGGGELALVAVALLLSLPAMLVELYLFRSFVTAFVWWTAVFAVGARATRGDRAGTGRSRS